MPTEYVWEYVWQVSYQAALIETDREELPNRIRAAKVAIDTRLRELQMDHGGSPEERVAISDALSALNTLRRELETRSPEKASGGG
jgi:hypothetical protein